MLPGWGERPVDERSILSGRLANSYDEWNQGLDWTDLLASLPHPRTSVAYTTYLDAPSFPTDPDPADYLAVLCARYGIREGGENTGTPTVAALDLSLRRAKTLHLVIVDWMNETEITAATYHGASGPTFAQVGKAYTSIIR
jgi:hypothetical protein